MEKLFFAEMEQTIKNVITGLSAILFFLQVS